MYRSRRPMTERWTLRVALFVKVCILAWCSQSRKGFCLIHLWSCCGKCCWCWFRPLRAFGCCSGRVHGSSSNGSNGAGVCCALLDSGSRRRASRGTPMIDRDTQRKRERERELSILIYNGTPRLISIAGGWMDGRTDVECLKGCQASRRLAREGGRKQPGPRAKRPPPLRATAPRANNVDNNRHHRHIREGGSRLFDE